MPVIVVGADTPRGLEIIGALGQPERETRAFVTDEGVATDLRGKGVKVALGDVSDESHVEAAAKRCFSAVLVTEAAVDGRERSFAATPSQVLEGWARAVAAAGVHRVIWVSEDDPPAVAVSEVVSVDPGHADLAGRVFALDDAQSI